MAKKARATIDWDGLAKLLVSDKARKEFATLCLTFDEVNHALETKISQIDDQQSIGFGLMLFEKLYQPLNSSSGHRFSWNPRAGLTVINVAAGTRGMSRWGGAVARNRMGEFLFSYTCIIPPRITMDLPWVINEALSHGRMGSAYNIQSSHPLMGDLCGEGDEPCPVELIYEKRRLIQQHGIIAFYKVCAKENESALSLVFSSTQTGLVVEFMSLPKSTQLAIKSDQSSLPSFCLGDCGILRRMETVSTDDGLQRSRALPRSLFRDDTAV